MNKTAIALLATLLCTPAFGADLAYKTAPATAQIYNWTGLYLGAHGGYGWGQTQDISNASAAKQDLKGGFGGIQAGYNWQGAGSPFVLGVETDISFGAIDNKWGGTNQFDPYYGKDSIKMFGTVRGRLGYAFDRVLIYGTGGFAWGDIEHGFGCDADRVAQTNGCQHKQGGHAFYVKDDTTSVGWTAGGGAEIAVSQNWTVKGEYLYTDFGANKIVMVDPNYPKYSERSFDTKFHNVKFGVNYRF